MANIYFKLAEAESGGYEIIAGQRYAYLNHLVPELKELMDGSMLSFTPTVEVSRIRPKHQEYIAVSIEGRQSSPSKAQAKKLRGMDEKNSSTRT